MSLEGKVKTPQSQFRYPSKVRRNLNRISIKSAKVLGIGHKYDVCFDDEIACCPWRAAVSLTTTNYFTFYIFYKYHFRSLLNFRGFWKRPWILYIVQCETESYLDPGEGCDLGAGGNEDVLCVDDLLTAICCYGRHLVLPGHPPETIDMGHLRGVTIVWFRFLRRCEWTTSTNRNRKRPDFVLLE